MAIGSIKILNLNKCRVIQLFIIAEFYIQNLRSLYG